MFLGKYLAELRKEIKALEKDLQDRDITCQEKIDSLIRCNTQKNYYETLVAKIAP
jgi:hypothetical protein